jgi:hypothetical protein
MQSILALLSHRDAHESDRRHAEQLPWGVLAHRAKHLLRQHNRE